MLRHFNWFHGDSIIIQALFGNRVGNRLGIRLVSALRHPSSVVEQCFRKA